MTMVRRAAIKKRFLTVFCFLFLGIIAAGAQAQEEGKDASISDDSGDKASATALKWIVEAGTVYSDNVFHITELQKADLETMDPDDVAGGRYHDMKSASDMILEPRVGLKMNMHSPLGAKLSLVSWIQYHAYVENTARNYPEAKLEVHHPVWKNGQVRTEWNYLDGFFRKNYLTEVNDINGNGNISSEERIYSPAIYDEVEGIVAYSHNWMKAKKQILSRLDTEILAGGGVRKYDDTIFRNRDRHIAVAGCGIRFGLLSTIDLKMVYRFEDVRTDNQEELVLFDETIAGEDVNNDGEIKGNAALETPVDRSCYRNSVEIVPALELMEHCTLFFRYRWRTSRYQSDNPLDIDHYHQTAYQHQFRSGMTYDFADNWSAQIEYRRTSDDSDEDDDYTENNILAAIRYQFE